MGRSVLLGGGGAGTPQPASLNVTVAPTSQNAFVGQPAAFATQVTGASWRRMHLELTRAHMLVACDEREQRQDDAQASAWFELFHPVCDHGGAPGNGTAAAAVGQTDSRSNAAPIRPCDADVQGYLRMLFLGSNLRGR